MYEEVPDVSKGKKKKKKFKKRRPLFEDVKFYDLVFSLCGIYFMRYVCSRQSPLGRRRRRRRQI